MKILVVEDDRDFAALVQTALAEQHYQVDVAADAQVAWDWLDLYEYDLILLDLVLPGESDGLCFCRELRANGNLTPVLLMTANEAQSVKVQGLDAGADDYLVKPFDWEELRARVRALLRRGQDAAAPQLRWGNLTLDPSSCEVTCEGQTLALTAKEYSLLELLLRNPQRIFSACALLDRLWDSHEAPSENAVRAHVKGLRHKLKAAGVEGAIETVYGLGYRLHKAPVLAIAPPPPVLNAPQAIARPTTSMASSAALDKPSAQRQLDLQAQLAQVWQRARQSYLAQVAVLDRLVGQSPDSRLGPEDWQQVCRQAHSLKGGLGSFGLYGAAAVAERVHDLVEPFPQTGSACSLGQPHSAELHRLLEQLREALEEATTLQLAPLVLPPPEPLETCWLVTADEVLSLRLSAEAAEAGLVLVPPPQALRFHDGRPELGTDLGADLGADLGVKGNHDQELPPLMLVDLADPRAQNLGVLSGRRWIALTEGNSLEQRVEAWRHGSACCLDRQTPSNEILAVVNQQLQQQRQSRLRAAKLLLVDDDPDLLALLKTGLATWDVALTVLDQPTQFWQVLQQTAPDLLILDVEMPGFNGLDLCRVVRQDPRWSRLPILFLSAHSDGPLLEQLFAAGADDFVAKPATPAMLMARVSHCLERRGDWPRSASHNAC